MPNHVLYRLAALAGLGSATVILVSAAKRASLLPATATTQLVAPLAQVLALFLITGLFLAYGRRAGLLGLIGYVLNAVAVALLVGAEFTTNLVFAYADAGQVTALLDGPLGTALVVASMLFLAGTALFNAALWLVGGVPKVLLVAYLAGAVPIALRAFVPEGVLQLGLVTLALAVAGLAITLWSYSVALARPEPLLTG